MGQPSFWSCLMLNEYIGIETIVFYSGIQNLFTSNLYLVRCENWDEENVPQQGCITNVCSVADTLNCHFHSFFETSLLPRTETTIPLNNPSQCTPYSLIFAAFCVSSVCWNDCPTFENATSTLLLFVKSIWNSVEASPPTACTRLFELTAPSVWAL